MHATTLAMVGATGGAGTTRTAVELATIGARNGHDVAVIDAAFTTQGLSAYVTGQIDTDCTALITDKRDEPLSAATYPIRGVDAAASTQEIASFGIAAAIPARAPFERLARAKTAEAAQRLERRIDEAATSYDAVIIDTAPVGSNEAVAAVTTADRVAAVFPSTPHGHDALQRLRGRIADVGGSVDSTIAVARDTGDDVTTAADAATVTLPPTDAAVVDHPTALTGAGSYTEAIAAVYLDAFDTTIDLEFDSSGVLDRFRR